MTAPTKEQVFANLDNAKENGEFGPDGTLYGQHASCIAEDLCSYASECEGCEPNDIQPFVEEWLAALKETGNE